MKKILFAIALFSVTIPAVSSASVNTAIAAFDFMGRTVTLKAGTIVLLETAELKASDNVTQGQIVHFRVKTDVRVGKRIVINTGALALGRIKSITENTFNSPETITVELTSVQAVDGQQIPLNGVEQTYTGTYPNEGTIVPTGQTVTAHVMNNIDIETTK